MSFKIKGLDEMIKDFEEAGKNVPSELRKLTDKMGVSLLGRAKRKTPVGKSKGSYVGGTLEASWQTKKIDAFTIAVYNNTSYANYVEYGHRTRNGKRFIPGVYMLKRSLDELIIDREIDKAFDSIIKNIWE